ALGKARDQARKISCLSNTRQINVASFGYLTDNKNIWIRGAHYNYNNLGEFNRNSDFYTLYGQYLGGNLELGGSTGGFDGNTLYSYGLRFNTADIFICPSTIRRTSNPNDPGPYNYSRNAYALWPSSGQDFVMTQEKLLRAGQHSRNYSATKIPATWSDRCNMLSGGNNGGTSETNHWDPTTGKPQGGNVARADGSGAWFEYQADNSSIDAFIVNGGYVGGHIAMPSNAVYAVFAGSTLLRTPARVILGRSGHDGSNFYDVFGQ
ncbi:MAG TPA: hypothetical protein DCM28_14950, partial [Phycisphaerales bacterium]|nr:hypothetical protein [Phycisphaerales bacterium]